MNKSKTYADTQHSQDARAKSNKKYTSPHKRRRSKKVQGVTPIKSVQMDNAFVTPSKPRMSFAERISSPSSGSKSRTRCNVTVRNATLSPMSPVTPSTPRVRGPRQSQHGNLGKEDLLKVRMFQRDICYVSGLPISLCTKPILSSPQWFGQYGRVRDISIIDNTNCLRSNWMCAHIKYFTQEAAEKAVKETHGRFLDEGRMLEANYGSQRYCEHFIYRTKCTKTRCPFRHSWCRLEEVMKTPNQSPSKTKGRHKRYRPVQVFTPQKSKVKLQECTPVATHVATPVTTPTPKRMSVGSTRSDTVSDGDLSPTNLTKELANSKPNNLGNPKIQHCPSTSSSSSTSNTSSKATSHTSSESNLSGPEIVHNLDRIDSVDTKMASPAHYASSDVDSDHEKPFGKHIEKHDKLEKSTLNLTTSHSLKLISERNLEISDLKQKNKDFESSIRQQQTRIEAYDQRYRSVRLEAEQRTKEVKELKLMTRTLTAERDQMCSKYQMMAMHYASQKQQKDNLLHAVRRLEEKVKRLQLNQRSHSALSAASHSPASHFAHSANGSMSPASMNGGMSPSFSFSGIQQGNHVNNMNNGTMNPSLNPYVVARNSGNTVISSPQKTVRQHKQSQHTNNRNMVDYALWQWADVYQWMVSLPESRPYAPVLAQSLKQQKIDGTKLKAMGHADLLRIGITEGAHRTGLLNHIGNLKSMFDVGLEELAAEL